MSTPAAWRPLYAESRHGRSQRMMNRPLAHHGHRQLPASRLAGARRRSTSTRSGPDRPSCMDDAVIAAVHDQLAAGLDVITDGEQTRLDFNLSFYGHLEGIEPARPQPAGASARRPTTSAGSTASPASSRRRAGSAPSRSSSASARLAPAGPALKASVPGPIRLSGRLVPERALPRPLGAHRGAASRIVRAELVALVGAGCREICRRRAVDELLRPSRGPRAARRPLQPHRRARSPGALPPLHAPLLRQLQGPRRRAAALRAALPRVSRPAAVDEIHVEMASREFAELEIIGRSPRARTWPSASST